jgi:hypothetical protein
MRAINAKKRISPLCSGDASCFSLNDDFLVGLCEENKQQHKAKCGTREKMSAVWAG